MYRTSSNEIEKLTVHVAIANARSDSLDIAKELIVISHVQKVE